MLRMGSWLSATRSNIRSHSTHSLNALDEPRNLDEALRAGSFILNDDPQAAEAVLAGKKSSFHQLIRSMDLFMRAALGFESEMIKEASESLAAAELASYNDHRQATRDSRRRTTSVYPPGSEYLLCNAEAQLMAAVVGVLNESIGDALKSFYKLRLAYKSLESILAAEEDYIRGQSASALGSRPSSKPSMIPGAFEAEDSDSEEFHEAPEPEDQRSSAPLEDPKSDRPRPTKSSKSAFYDESLSTPALHEKFADANLDDLSSPRKPTAGGLPLLGEDAGTRARRLELVHSNITVDQFIHSGASCCFGMLLIMLSLIPPSMSKLLYVIGFRGDRERGLRMLWGATEVENVNAGLAGLILLGYYNGLLALGDISSVPVGENSDDEAAAGGFDERLLYSYPKARLLKLLSRMRGQYPNSYLWLLEESRMMASEKKLDQAIGLLNPQSGKHLKQVEAFMVFEKALDSMCLHRYSDVTDLFLQCIELNKWSHALYYYFAASAQVELYRQEIDVRRREGHAKRAKQYFDEIPKNTGKKKFIGKTIPWEVYVLRKIEKWSARAEARQCSFVDAIGVSPYEESLCFWNGFRRMPYTEMDRSLQTWQRTRDQPGFGSEPVDERSIEKLLRATLLRHLGRLDVAKELLQQVIGLDKLEFKKPLADDWVQPTAHYEMGVVCWLERETRSDAVQECKQWLGKAAKWERYELDQRIGMKITMALDTIKRYEALASSGTI